MDVNSTLIPTIMSDENWRNRRYNIEFERKNMRKGKREKKCLLDNPFSSATRIIWFQIFSILSTHLRRVCVCLSFFALPIYASRINFSCICYCVQMRMHCSFTSQSYQLRFRVYIYSQDVCVCVCVYVSKNEFAVEKTQAHIALKTIERERHYARYLLHFHYKYKHNKHIEETSFQSIDIVHIACDCTIDIFVIFFLLSRSYFIQHFSLKS